MSEFYQHSHTDLGRWAGCRACLEGMPDQINRGVPEGCTYHWEDTPVDGLLVCNRHGFTSLHAEHETDTDPCLAIKCEGEFAGYIHDPSAAVISHEHEMIVTDLMRFKRLEDAEEAKADYEDYMTYFRGADCE